jgi:DNA invertase Pin-like site-specific DNA recombinase
MARIGYARVSSESQRPALTIQIDALLRDGATKIFSEVASGNTNSRPEFVKMLDYVCAGEDQIVVWRLDRFSRSGIRDMFETLDFLAEKKIAFRFLTENLDSTTSSGKMMISIQTALNTYERELILERCNAGRERPDAKLAGRKPTLTPAKIKAAQTLLQNGSSMTATAAAIGVSRSSLYRDIPSG